MPPTHQPAYFDHFQCIGDKCEDTCCQGMSVSIDAATFEKYKGCSDVDLKPRFEQFITIQTEPTPNNFGTIQLKDAQCPFLSDKLCGIQQKLGVEYLSRVCDTYPRIVNTGENLVERSLDLSCPEAARLVLNRREPTRFESTNGAEPANWPLRHLILSILQNRRYSVSQRVLLIGHVCSKVNLAVQANALGTLPQILEGFHLAIEAGLFDGHLHQYSASPIPQLAVVLELVVGRIQLDYTSPKFLELYSDFTGGLGLTPDSTLEQLGERYRENYEAWFMPFTDENEHILENYLVAHAYKNQFPVLSEDIESQYMFMATCFSMAKALLIGAAGSRKELFSADDAIRILQVFTRTIEHCTTFPALVFRTLADKGIGNIAGMAIISQNIATPKRRAARC